MVLLAVLAVARAGEILAPVQAVRLHLWAKAQRAATLLLSMETVVVAAVVLVPLAMQTPTRTAASVALLNLLPSRAHQPPVPVVAVGVFSVVLLALAVLVVVVVQAQVEKVQLVGLRLQPTLVLVVAAAATP
jgi:hypothetical protein